MVSRFNSRAFVLTFSVLLLFAFNYFVFEETRKTLVDTILSFWTLCYTLMIATCSIKDYSVFLKKLTSISKLIAWISAGVVVLYFFNYVRSSDEGIYYSMGFGYACLLPLIVNEKLMFDKPSLISVIRFLIILGACILLGSRGPLIGLISFTIFYIFFFFSKEKRVTAKGKTFVILFLLFVLIVILFYQKIFEFLYFSLKQFGIESRTIYTFSTGSASSHDSGRGERYEKIFNALINDPFSFRGIHADYLLIGGYTHNIVLEVLYELGAFVGIPFLLIILYYAMKSIFAVKVNEKTIVLLMLMCASLPCLFISSVVWSTHSFWMWFGVMIVQPGASFKKAKFKEYFEMTSAC